MPVALFIALIVAVLAWSVARHFASARVSAAGIIAVALVAILTTWVVAPGWLVPSPGVPTGMVVGWELPLGFAGHKDDLTQETTVIAMVVDHPGCASNGGEWLGDPVIAYTPWSVTITMHSRDALPTPCIGYYLSGEYTKVQLSEPLGGRRLFDGSKSPPHPRSPSDSPSSMSR